MEQKEKLKKCEHALLLLLGITDWKHIETNHHLIEQAIKKLLEVFPEYKISTEGL